MESPLRKKTAEGNSYLLFGLIAIELFMSFSFLGYIHIDPISITFVYIPVLIAGFLLGPKEAALVGAVFGLASMWKATAFYVGPADAVFSPTMSGKPLQSILLSVGSRVLFGWITGLMYQMAKNSRHPLAWALAVTTVGRTIHALLVYGFMGILFPETGFGIVNTWDDTLRSDFILFVILVDVIILACYVFQKSQPITKLWHRIQIVDQENTAAPYNKRWIVGLIVLVFVSSISVALYFTNRITRVMSQHGVNLSEQVSYDIMHLEIQFLLGIFALSAILMIVIIIYQKNSTYLYYEAKLDGLTRLLSRQQFFQEGERILEGMRSGQKEKTGYFIILDVDHFKMINDKYGHPTGDKVLQAVADSLRKSFNKKGLIGRLGGDEFVVLIHHFMAEKDMREILNKMRDEIGRIQFMDDPVTCSVGVIPIKEKTTVESLYCKADKLLYEAKQMGKDQFVLGNIS